MDKPNISTEHQPKGAARNPSDTLNRENEQVGSGQRSLNDDAANGPDAANSATRSDEKPRP